LGPEAVGRTARAFPLGRGLEVVVPASPLTATTRTKVAPAMMAMAGSEIPDDRA
jgi:hypothetical protein